MYSFILAEIYPTINIFPLQYTLSYLTNFGNQVFTLFLNYLHIEGTKCIFMMLKELFTLLPFHKNHCKQEQHCMKFSALLLEVQRNPTTWYNRKNHSWSEIRDKRTVQSAMGSIDLICVCFLYCSVPNTYNRIWHRTAKQGFMPNPLPLILWWSVWQ